MYLLSFLQKRLKKISNWDKKEQISTLVFFHNPPIFCILMKNIFIKISQLGMWIEGMDFFIISFDYNSSNSRIFILNFFYFKFLWLVKNIKTFRETSSNDSQHCLLFSCTIWIHFRQIEKKYICSFTKGNTVIFVATDSW